MLSQLSSTHFIERLCFHGYYMRSYSKQKRTFLVPTITLFYGFVAAQGCVPAGLDRRPLSFRLVSRLNLPSFLCSTHPFQGAHLLPRLASQTSITMGSPQLMQPTSPPSKGSSHLPTTCLPPLPAGVIARFAGSNRAETVVRRVRAYELHAADTLALDGPAWAHPVPAAGIDAERICPRGRNRLGPGSQDGTELCVCMRLPRKGLLCGHRGVRKTEERDDRQGVPFRGHESA